jgi:hypothetical protein
MRRHRIAVLTVLAALLAALGLAPLASAQPGAKPEHHSKYSIKKLTPTTYLFKGKVTTDPGGDLLVLKQADGIDRYTVWKQVKIRKNGQFSTRLTGSRGDCFRMRINKTDGYRTTIEDLGCIVPNGRTAARKPMKREITIEFTAVGTTKFKLTGTASPDGEKKAVVLLYASGSKGTLKKVKTVKTNGQGAYAFGGLNKEGFYRVRMAPSNGYAVSFSKKQRVCAGLCT